MNKGSSCPSELRPFSRSRRNWMGLEICGYPFIDMNAYKLVKLFIKTISTEEGNGCIGIGAHKIPKNNRVSIIF